MRTRVLWGLPSPTGRVDRRENVDTDSTVVWLWIVPIAWTLTSGTQWPEIQSCGDLHSPP